MAEVKYVFARLDGAEWFYIYDDVDPYPVLSVGVSKSEGRETPNHISLISKTETIVADKDLTTERTKTTSLTANRMFMVKNREGELDFPAYSIRVHG